MARKTERLYASAPLNGDSMGLAQLSFGTALSLLRVKGADEGREVLFDTLEVEIERNTVDVSSIADSGRASTYVTITVSAEAVLR